MMATWHILCDIDILNVIVSVPMFVAIPVEGLSADNNLAARSIRPLVVIRLFGMDRIVSPPAMIFFSRPWYVIQKISRPTYKEWLETLDQKPARHYTDGDFLGLHANIAEAVGQRHIALVLGDNIEYIVGEEAR